MASAKTRTNTATPRPDLANDPLRQSYSGGVLGGLAVTNLYDSLLRRSTLSILNGSSVRASTLYGYDAASRLLTVSDGTNSATYFYVANSPLVDHTCPVRHEPTAIRLRFTDGCQFCLPSTSQAIISRGEGQQFVNAFDTTCPVRESARPGSLHMNAHLRSCSQSAMPSFSHGVHNRTGTQAGGDQTGANLRQTAYTNDLNNLNEIMSRGGGRAMWT
jgi:hypothetical protein